MKRSIAVAATAAVVLAGVTAGSAHAKPRRQKVQRHDSTGYVGAAGSAGAEPTIYTDEGTFATERYERDVSVTILDRSGQAVSAVVRQDADEDGTWEVDEAFCGSTEAPVAIKGGAPVVVKVQPGPCADGTPAAMTSGSIRVTFTGLVKPGSAPAVPAYGCAPAKAAVPARELTETYVLAAGVGAADQGMPFTYFEYSDTESVGAATFQSVCGETHVELTLADKAGLPVRAIVGVDPDGRGDAPEDLAADLCGGTEDPLAITPGASVTVYVLDGPCADGTPAAATTGTVTGTFGTLKK